MMKKHGLPFLVLNLVVIIIAAVVFFVPYLSAEQGAGNIACVDSQRIVDESKAGQISLKELEEFKKKNEEELSKRDKELKEMEDELRKKRFALSPDAQSQKEESIRRKKIEFNRFKEDKEIELKDLYFKHLNKIKEDIVRIVQKIGQEKGYAVIFNKDDSVIYADPNSDISNMIIETYDKEMAKGSMK